MTIRFEAIGGGDMNKLPGVKMPPTLGTTYLWFSLDTAPPGRNDFLALLGQARLGPAERDALERTRDPTPSVGWGGGTWWRVAGHFDDPGARECRSDGPWSLSEDGHDTLIEFTTEQAVAQCRDLFVIESLQWLLPPTPSR